MDKKELEKLIIESYNITEVCIKKYGNRYCGNRQTIKNYIKEYNIDTSHFTYRAKDGGRKRLNEIDLSNILIQNSSYSSTTKLKKRLYNDGLKEKKCEICGQEEDWYGKKIVHILDHINGINDDNRIENLRIVCPNCNSTLDTHGGKNIKLKGNTKSKKTLTEKDKFENRIDSSKAQRIIERPSYNELIKQVDMFGYSETGRKYGVSDNAIRKWIKFYKKYELGD